VCDYSLHHVATRPARIEDKLVTIGEPNVAVCLLPGTARIRRSRRTLGGILPSKKIGQRLARFRQINMDAPTSHHDAVEFPDGQIVLLTRLCEGQRATVLQLPATAAVAKEPARSKVGERSHLA
jgi:hypothetical protein